jgi:predicted nucleotidyltransferase
VKKEKKAITGILGKRSDILFGYLFGSQVKGYGNQRSDWDIAIYFNTSIKQNGRWHEFELEAEISRAIGAAVQVTVLNAPLSPVFGFEIIKNGILLIDRDPSLRIDFENRKLRHYHDWQYFLNRQIEAERYLRGIRITRSLGL